MNIFMFTGVLLALIFTADNGLAFDEKSLTQLRETRMCPGCDLSGADLSGADLSGANLSGADLRNANLTKAMLIETNLENTNLEGSRVYGVSAWRLRLKVSGTHILGE
jgi:uncharacterized protein YjbI with pentapeptide repeats